MKKIEISTDSLIKFFAGVCVVVGLAFIAFISYTAKNIKAEQLNHQKVLACDEILDELCTVFVGCYETTTHDKCIMTLRETSICEDPRSYNLKEIEDNLEHLKTMTCRDFTNSLPELPALGKPNIDL